MNSDKRREIEYSYADKMHDFCHCLLQMKKEKVQLGGNSSRDSFAW